VVHPFSITGLYLNAESALELPAHTIFKSRTEIGDELVISRFDSPQSVGTEIPAEETRVER
jgi:hypothetical protein